MLVAVNLNKVRPSAKFFIDSQDPSTSSQIPFTEMRVTLAARRMCYR
jgi:hypothetical protein